MMNAFPRPQGMKHGVSKDNSSWRFLYHAVFLKNRQNNHFPQVELKSSSSGDNIDDSTKMDYPDGYCSALLVTPTPFAM